MSQPTCFTTNVRMLTSEWNCTFYPALQANPDVGGIGVRVFLSNLNDNLHWRTSQTIIAFLSSAYITLICCIAKIRIDHLRSPDGSTARLDVWSFALRSTILSYSDQQVVVGISVLLGGISQLKLGLDSYHWQTIVNLAWFSAFTHILTLAGSYDPPALFYCICVYFDSTQSRKSLESKDQAGPFGGHDSPSCHANMHDVHSRVDQRNYQACNCAQQY